MVQTVSTFTKRIPPGAAGAGTLQALMDRQKAAQLAREKSMTMEQPIQSVWQGLGHVGNVVSAGIREGRANRQEADARQQLAELVAGFDPVKGPTQEQLAQTQIYDPELAAQYREEAWRAREAAAGREFQTGERIAGQEFDIRKLTEADKIGDVNRTTEDVIADENRTTEDVIGDENAKRDAEIARQNADYAAGVETKSIGTNAAAREAEADRLGLEKGSLERNRYILTGEVAGPTAVNPADAFTPGQAEMDKKFAVDVLEWEQAGGANATAQITQVNKALDLLEKNSGPGGVTDVTGLTAGLLNLDPTGVMSAYLNPDGTIAREAIQETVQSTLRATLGSQFTEKEGERLMARAFHPSLPPAENIRRAKILLAKVQQIAANKGAMVEHYKKNNATLSGYKGPAYSTSELLDLFPDDAGAGAGGGGSADVDEILKGIP